jgi:hypothetical protein
VNKDSKSVIDQKQVINVVDCVWRNKNFNKK